MKPFTIRSIEMIESGQFPHLFCGNHQSGCKNIYPIDCDSELPKVICLGCSITHGYITDINENRDYSFPFILGRFLAGKYSVLNMGRISYGLKILIDWFYNFEHEINNVSHVIIQIPDYKRQPLHPWQDDSPHHYTSIWGSRFLLKDGSFALAEHVSSYPDEFYGILNDYRFVSEIISQDLVGRDFERLTKFVNELLVRGIHVVILYYQYWSYPETQFLADKYYEIISRYCNAKGIDLLPYIGAEEVSLRKWVFDGVHLNEQGHVEFAKMLKPYICE